jgi:hypothetical protein
MLSSAPLGIAEPWITMVIGGQLGPVGGTLVLCGTTVGISLKYTWRASADTAGSP